MGSTKISYNPNYNLLTVKAIKLTLSIIYAAAPWLHILIMPLYYERVYNFFDSKCIKMDNIASSAKTDTFRVRINPELRKQLEAVYNKNGLTLTDAVNVFFQQSLNAGGFPFAVTEGNAAMIKAKALPRLMNDLEAGKKDTNTHSEDTVNDMFGIEK